MTVLPCYLLSSSPTTSCSLYRGDEFHLDPVAEATGDEMTASEREYEKDMRLKHMAKPVTTTQSEAVLSSSIHFPIRTTTDICYACTHNNSHQVNPCTVHCS